MSISINFINKITLLLSCFVIVSSKYSIAQHTQAKVIQVNPPHLGFYSKYLDFDGIPIRSRAIGAHTGATCRQPALASITDLTVFSPMPIGAIARRSN